jgi:phage FluMu protein Com
MEAYGGPTQPPPTIAQCLNGGYGWLQVKCHRCETEASIRLNTSAGRATRRSGN